MLLLNNQQVDYFTFPGGELQVKLPLKIETERVILTWKPIDASEITFLGLVVNALKNMGIWDIDLDILYLPYARQDRVCSSGEAHSLEVICDFLDNLGLTIIRIWDVHNEIATEQFFEETEIRFVNVDSLFSRYKILDNFEIHNFLLCSPDEGALVRVNELSDIFYFSSPPITMSKKRCLETGRIIGINLVNFHQLNRSIEGKNILIVDDICDGGGTFNQAAQILREEGAADLYLYVTHGIFSKGLDLLQENFKKIICHHVLHDDKFQSTDKLTILREFPHGL